ncbi:MAG: hypothetical protein WC321_01395 [Candidatus Omnitrophota bacterium]|jgi:hypothetical protein
MHKDELRIEIAKTCISLKVNHREMRRNILNYYKSFLSRKKPQLSITVKQGDYREPYNKRLICKNISWKFAQGDGCYFFLFYKGALALLGPDFKSAEFFTRNPESQLLLFPFPVMLLTSLLSREKKGIMLHSCGVLDGKDAFLFVGPSGSGKSTLANLCGDRTLISDDKIIIRKYGNIFRVFGNPWWHGNDKIKKSVSSQGAAISRIFFLQKAKRNFITPLKGLFPAVDLMRNSFFPFWDPKATANTFEICSEITKKIPCFKLGFIPDQSVWRVIN